MTKKINHNQGGLMNFNDGMLKMRKKRKRGKRMSKTKKIEDMGFGKNEMIESANDFDILPDSEETSDADAIRFANSIVNELGDVYGIGQINEDYVFNDGHDTHFDKNEGLEVESEDKTYDFVNKGCSGNGGINNKKLENGDKFDVDGSWTGTPCDLETGEEIYDDMPVQDADDL